ncbi:MAG TPA: CBS domain-containing protein [Terriglobales bacterium]|jgi:CBS domain-containing protein
MKVLEVMTANPVCCLFTDTAQKAAQILRDQHVGSLPVIRDQQSRQLVGMVTDRDICCSVVADGLDPRNTSIEKYISADLVTCRDDDNLDKCEQAMQEHQIRRIPVVDDEGRCIGIVSQADLALKDKPEKVSRTVAEISKPGPERPTIAA